MFIAEFAIRIAAPQQLILIRPDLWEPADTVGWVHRPNVDIEINTGERTVSVFTDEAGFRVGANGPVDADRKVLLLGDSFMEALQVDYEASSPGLIEAALPELVGEPVALRNAGVGGWDPDQYLLRAQSLLAREDFDLVVTALFMGNDVIRVRRDYVPPRSPVERHQLRMPRGFSWTEFVDAFLRPLNDALEVRSHAFVLVKNRMQNARREVGLDALPFPRYFMRSASPNPRWAVTARLCEDIAALAAEHGSEALFVLVPTSFQVDPADLMDNVRGFDLDIDAIDLEQPNRMLSAELTSRGLRFHDVLEGFRARHESGERLFGTVDRHFSPEGNRLFADLVAPRIADALLGDEPGADGRSGGGGGRGEQ
ncbi:MAG: hypothetical protein OEU54_02255 [Gemmatimonadota bacterium]|nr:hypothetical protein [Gemmatimonadota bacterium]